MTKQVIPDAAVEAAWLTYLSTDVSEADIVRILEAAAPHMLAQAKAEALEESAEDFTGRVTVTRQMIKDDGRESSKAALHKAYGMEMAATALRSAASNYRAAK